MHVLYIHQYFTTREGAGGTRSYEMARALIARGHRVTMVCGSAGRSVTGLDGAFTRGRRAGTVDGIDIVEFDLAYSNRDSIPTRAVKFATFALRSMSLAVKGDHDLVFATSTPLTAALPGIASRWLAGKPFVFEVRDLWPELPRAMGMRNPLALGAMHVLEWLGYRSATRTIALAPGIADGIARLGVPRARIDLIPNGCDFDFFAGIAPVPPHAVAPDRIAVGDLVAVFAGAHGRANGLDAVLNAAEALKRHGRAGIKLLLVGEGSEKPRLQQSAEARGLDNVVFLDAMPKTRAAGLLKGADVGLQILADIPAFYRGTSPNKFFDYLAAGRPVLINYPGWLADLVGQAGCGFAVPPRNAEVFAQALIQAADDRGRLAEMGRKAAALGARDFDRSRLAATFVASLETALSPQPRR